MECIYCKKPVTALEVALTQKLISRRAVEFACLDCMAKKFNVTKQLLIEKAKNFQALDCALFDGIDIDRCAKNK